MKVKIEKLIISEWRLSAPDYAKANEFFEINEHILLHPFVYNSNKGGTFKLSLEWELNIKNKEKTFEVFYCNADQDFLMQIDGNNDRETLSNMIQTSAMHLQDALDLKLKGNPLSGYKMRWFDPSPSVENILNLVQK